MSKNEKVLSIGLAVVCGLYLISQVVWPALTRPIADQQKKLDAARKARDGEDEKVIAALGQIQVMTLHKEQSLSSNVSEASLGYEQWLSDLAENVAKFQDPEVSRETTSPSRDNSYVAIKIRVTGRGTMKQLREFLYRFHRASVLHQISSLTIDAVDNSSNPLLDIVLMADGLSLRSAPVKGPTLFARSEVVSVADDPDRVLTVADATVAWPEETPFEIRVDDKFLTVLERVHQVWEITGSGSKAEAGATVTLFEKKAGDPTTEAAADGTADSKVAASKSDSASKADSASKSDSASKADSKKIAPPAKAAITTKLVKAWDGKSNTIVVSRAEGFAPGRLQIQIGGDTVEVVARREVWRIDDQKFRASQGTVVEASPVRPEFEGVSIEKFAALVDLNPFAKKRTIPPNFLLTSSTSSRNIERGKSAVLTPMVTDLGPNAAAPKIEVLSQLPPGMTFADGVLTWVTTEEMEPGKFDLKLRASSDALEKPLEESFEVSLVVPVIENKPPYLTAPERAVVAVLGQTMTFQVTASDLETPADQLRFSAGANFPEGATVDPMTGEVRWAAPKDGQPGPVDFPITVVDAGSPPQSGSVTVKVDVQEDRAIYTYLTGSIAADDRKQAWLYDRSTNNRVILEEGDEFEYAGFEALVLSIDRDFMTMQQERNTLRLDIGNSLREAVVIATAPLPEKPAESTEGAAPATSDGNPTSTEAELEALLKGLDDADAKPGEAPATTEKPAEPRPEAPPTAEPKTATSADDPASKQATAEDLEALLKALDEAETAKPGEPKPAGNGEPPAKPDTPPEPEARKPEAPAAE
ncbi:MAG: putative Ig domain-containing protein [Planctomycetota bacterium]|nr:putative Ig domain-containing protein [Planctomycetota bacterium]MDA1248798.1 putative Ig domain-containing protein [Planctomycetota bacterium]